MVEGLIALIAIGIILFIIFYIAKLVVEALGLPGIIMKLVGIILALIFLMKLLQVLGVEIGGI